MHVPVGNENTRASQRLRVARGDDDVIEEAKPHGTLGERMMPGRTGDGERPFPAVSAQRLLDGGDCHTRCRQDALPAARPEKCIGVE